MRGVARATSLLLAVMLSLLFPSASYDHSLDRTVDLNLPSTAPSALASSRAAAHSAFPPQGRDQTVSPVSHLGPQSPMVFEGGGGGGGGGGMRKAKAPSNPFANGGGGPKDSKSQPTQRSMSPSHFISLPSPPSQPPPSRLSRSRTRSSTPPSTKRRGKTPERSRAPPAFSSLPPPSTAPSPSPGLTKHREVRFSEDDDDVFQRVRSHMLTETGGSRPSSSTQSMRRSWTGSESDGRRRRATKSSVSIPEGRFSPLVSSLDMGLESASPTVRAGSQYFQAEVLLRGLKKFCAGRLPRGAEGREWGLARLPRALRAPLKECGESLHGCHTVPLLLIIDYVQIHPVLSSSLVSPVTLSPMRCPSPSKELRCLERRGAAPGGERRSWRR